MITCLVYAILGFDVHPIIFGGARSLKSSKLIEY